ncbi:hypothetical protein MKX03_007048 [Papaver bracteatum]|nr:hypothetical protein MKX03_007048 [Papaver bracteatum]
MEETYCSDCKSVIAVINDHSTGDTIFSDCGLVLEAYSIDETSEWNTFPDQSNHNNPHRVGDKSNLLLSNNDPDKGLIEAFKAIKAISERLCLVSTIKDLANDIYKKMEDSKSSKGRNKNAMFGACLYIMKEICWAANDLKKKILRRVIIEIKKILDKSMDDGKDRYVANATRVALGTIKISYQEIYPYASQLVPSWYVIDTFLCLICLNSLY